MATAKKDTTFKLTLTLNEAETMYLLALTGCHVGGLGKTRDLNDDIYEALIGEMPEHRSRVPRLKVESVVEVLSLVED
jgi:hypothetical protein